MGLNVNNIASNNVGASQGADGADILYNHGKMEFSTRRRPSADDHIYDEIIYPVSNDQKIVT